MHERFDRARSALRGLPLVAALIGLLAIVALASRSGRGEGDVPTLPPEVFDTVFTIGALVVALVVLVAFWQMLRARRKPGQLPASHSWRMLAGLLVLLAVMTTFKQVRPNPPERGEGSPVEVQPTPEQPAPGEQDRRRATRFRWEIAAVAGGLAVAGVGGWYWLGRRRELPADPDELDAELPRELSDLFDLTLDDLHRERDPRRAVIAAYARAEAILARHGLPRHRSETPLEYLARVLRELRVRASAALELTDLFERAKFSRHEIDEQMKADAIAALVLVRDDLRAPAGLPQDRGTA